jgi:hypothetical protein
MWKCCKLLPLGIPFVLLWACTGPQLPVTGDAPGAVKQFASEFAALHRDTEDSLASLLECFHWQGVRPDTREAIERSLRYDLETPIQRITIEPWQPDFLPQYFGTEHHPNLKPQWVMHLHYQSDPHHVLSLPIGRGPDATIRIANPVPLSDSASIDHESQ